MKKIKKIKYIISAILVILLLNQTLCVWGAEDEWYSLHEVNETQEIREKDLETWRLCHMRVILWGHLPQSKGHLVM